MRRHHLAAAAVWAAGLGLTPAVEAQSLSVPPMRHISLPAATAADAPLLELWADRIQATNAAWAAQGTPPVAGNGNAPGGILWQRYQRGAETVTASIFFGQGCEDAPSGKDVEQGWAVCPARIRVQGPSGTKTTQAMACYQYFPLGPNQAPPDGSGASSASMSEERRRTSRRHRPAASYPRATGRSGSCARLLGGVLRTPLGPLREVAQRRRDDSALAQTADHEDEARSENEQNTEQEPLHGGNSDQPGHPSEGEQAADGHRADDKELRAFADSAGTRAAAREAEPRGVSHRRGAGND